MKEMARLRWQCRRGMLELDCLLGAFLEEGYAKLEEKEQAVFRRLLEEPDPLLFRWLLVDPARAPEGYQPLIGKMRACCSSRPMQGADG